MENDLEGSPFQNKKMFRFRFIHIWSLFLAGFLPAVPFAQQAPALSNATLISMEINGETNINSFQLFLEDARTGKSPVPVSGSYEANSILFRIPLELLNCKNDKILADFYDLVQADKFSEVLIKIGLHDFHRLISENNNTPVLLSITLAGVTRELKTKSSYIQHMSDEKIMSGNVTLSLTDFSLKPPKKIFGLIRLNNHVNINFTISIINSRIS